MVTKILKKKKKKNLFSLRAAAGAGWSTLVASWLAGGGQGLAGASGQAQWSRGRLVAGMPSPAGSFI